MIGSSIIERLRAQGHRVTSQRLVILEIIEQDGGHLSAGEIFARAVQRLPGITEPTVYRTLDFLTQHGLALVTHVGDGRLVYETAERNHHHLTCRGCGDTVEIGTGLLENLRESIHQQTGYLVDCCHITFLGLCPGCLSKTTSPDAA